MMEFRLFPVWFLPCSVRNTLALTVETLSSSTATANWKLLLASLEPPPHPPQAPLMCFVGVEKPPRYIQMFSLFSILSAVCRCRRISRLYQNAVELEFKCFCSHTAAAVIRTCRRGLEARQPPPPPTCLVHLLNIKKGRFFCRPDASFNPLMFGFNHHVWAPSLGRFTNEL